MSSAGRGERSGGEHDVYPTPAWAVHRLLDRVTLPPGIWFEPCAGYGAIVRAASGYRNMTPIWLAGDIRPEVMPLLQESMREASSPPMPYLGNFLLRDDVLREVSVVLTNPPFHSALAFLLKAMDIAPQATICFLLRKNFVGGDKRCEWLRDHMPDEFTLPNRPSFREEGTDSTEYAWMVWAPGAGHRVRRQGLTEILDPTPLVIRQQHKEEALTALRGVRFPDAAIQLELGAA